MLGFFYMYFDPVYLLFMVPGLLLAVWAQIRVKTAYATAGRYRGQSGLTGAQAAQQILNVNGLDHVRIERTQSMLGDHYDPRTRVLRLSPGVYDEESLAALGIAAHEAGHAIQHARAYTPLALRSTLVPVAMLGDNLAWPLIIFGLMFQSMQWLATLGLLLFGTAVLFTLITLPVEFDASRRARAVLLSNGMVTTAEDKIVGRVLNAAALTYVAAAVTAMLQMLYFLMRVSARRD